jgi:hypothetical protein
MKGRRVLPDLKGGGILKVRLILVSVVQIPTLYLDPLLPAPRLFDPENFCYLRDFSVYYM